MINLLLITCIFQINNIPLFIKQPQKNAELSKDQSQVFEKLLQILKNI